MAETPDIPDSAAQAETANNAGAVSQGPLQSAAPSQNEAPAISPGQPFEIAVLALQNTTLFPETVVPLAVGRPRSVAAVEAALSTPEKLLGCVTVRPDATTGADATSKDLYEVGTLVMVKRMERIEDSMHLIAQGTERIRVLGWKQEEPYLRAVVRILPEVAVIDPEEVEATKRNVQSMIQQAL